MTELRSILEPFRLPGGTVPAALLHKRIRALGLDWSSQMILVAMPAEFPHGRCRGDSFNSYGNLSLAGGTPQLPLVAERGKLVLHPAPFEAFIATLEKGPGARVRDVYAAAAESLSQYPRWKNRLRELLVREHPIKRTPYHSFMGVRIPDAS